MKYLVKGSRGKHSQDNNKTLLGSGQYSTTENIQIGVVFQSRQNLRIMIVIRRFCFLPSACTSYTGANCSLFHKYYFKTQVWAERTDMYPLYWTPSRGGIIMRYTYEYKRKCVELYREGKWPETPEGVSDKSFRDKVRLWVRAEDSRGPEALKHKNFNRNWTPEERLELVSQVMSGKSCVSVAIEAGIQDRLLYQWVQNYKTKGYNGLVEMKKGRPSKGVPQMKKEEARPLNESEREELIRLRAENEYIKAENEVIKKEIALREERHAAQLKARKQRSSKSCVKKDTN